MYLVCCTYPCERHTPFKECLHLIVRELTRYIICFNFSLGRVLLNLHNSLPFLVYGRDSCVLIPIRLIWQQPRPATSLCVPMCVGDSPTDHSCYSLLTCSGLFVCGKFLQPTSVESVEVGIPTYSNTTGPEGWGLVPQHWLTIEPWFRAKYHMHLFLIVQCYTKI